MGIIYKPETNPVPGPDKNGPSKKQTRWKNRTSTTKIIAICLKSYEMQWKSTRPCLRANNL